MAEKVIVIGAGPAGLTAGYELLKKGKGKYEVIILEESREIGGISRTVRHYGNRMDIGGHRFFSKNEEVTKWWQEMLPLQGKPAYDDKVLGRRKKYAPGGPDPETEDRVMLRRDRVSRIYYKKRFFDYPVSLKWQTLKNMGMLTTIKAGFSYLYASLFPKKEDSLENFYINRFGKVLYGMFFEGYTKKLWGRHPREISADWGAQRVKGLSVTAILKDIFNRLPLIKWIEVHFASGKNNKVKMNKKETSLIEEFYYPKYGPGQMWETVAKEFEALGGTILMGAKVVRIHDKNGVTNPFSDGFMGVDTKNSGSERHIESVEYVVDGERKVMRGDIIISSMPLKDLVEGMEEVPEDIRRIAGGLPYRDFVTIGVLLKRLKLKNETKIRTLNHLVPDCWIYVQDTGVKLGRIQIFNNWSPYMVEDVEDKVWIGLEYFCNEKDRFFQLTEQQYIRLAGKELVKMGLIGSAEDILDAHVERVKKAYPAYFDTYKEIDRVIAYLDTYDNLYCVGRNGQHRYNNMDHSMMTAFEAVKNIVHGIRRKDNLWKVNAEGEYHETK